MLKRLELAGFKSFADKTELAFDKGITAIVGPNGSGKSNVVDAIRWILGEQSPKSLRGSEMADVIFNGSASRKSFGYAEATLTLNNSDGRIPIDAPEVHITRRVYRSGDGEYMINRQPSRLKDIKDLFMGTGVGTHAYSVIEQGKVDVLLQASNKERRAVFEEAAGISRFRAKKIETLRRLERTEQNLLRLGDIIDEVNRQLRSVKYQAAKARRYQKHTARLKELRVSLSLADYHQLSENERSLAQAVAQLNDKVIAASTQAQTLEAENSRLETAIIELDEQLRAVDGELADRKGAINDAENAIRYERSHLEEAVQQIRRCRGEITGLTTRTAELAAALAQTDTSLEACERARIEQRDTVQQHTSALAALSQRLLRLQETIEQAKTDMIEVMRASSRIQNDLVGIRSRLEGLDRESGRLTERRHALQAQLHALGEQLAHLQTTERDVRAQQVALGADRDALQQQAQQRQAERQQAAERIAQLREARSALIARIEILEDLERRQEGVGPGVKEALQRIAAAGSNWSGVYGMLADIITTDVEHAPLVELALGERTQHIVVEHQSVVARHLRNAPYEFPSRVSFVGLDRATRSEPVSYPEPGRFVGFVARLSDKVQCDANVRPLVEATLGRTLLVEDLATALHMAEAGFGHFRFITRRGELLCPDGTITVGAISSATGLLSRKSQLRELQTQREDLDQQMAEAASRHQELSHQCEHLQTQCRQVQARIDEVSHHLNEIGHEIEQKRADRSRLEEEDQLTQTEMDQIRQDMATLAQREQGAQRELESVQQQQQTIQEDIQHKQAEAQQYEQTRLQYQQEATRLQVELATTEERIRSLQGQQQAIKTDLDERQARLGRLRQDVAQCRTRLERAEAKILNEESRVAALYLEKEAIGKRSVAFRNQRAERRERLTQLSVQGQSARRELHELEEALHARQLGVSEARLKRQNLEDRIRDDYERELAELYKGYQPQELDHEAAEREINELRRKIHQLGSVNEEAIQELEELEVRSSQLSYQYEDLTKAKSALEEIIRKINRDSRRMFRETFDATRMHFQELFRKLFGGGKADVLLEDEEDILECGIEIIARPPGKEPRSISLLSGGEKTLTAVALLLAIFRSRPSPFCILDEVDAALDEANIGRFVTVLGEFLDHSQFIIITHSKKTMCCANVIYGVTMQESGVSKKVSVKFEDQHQGAAEEGSGEIQAA